MAQERADWLARAAAWDAQAAGARERWLAPVDSPTQCQIAAPTSLRVLVEYCAVRSTCRRCLRRIGEGDLRCGVQSFVPMFGQTVVSWHHFRCLALSSVVKSTEELLGFDGLRPREQARIKKSFAVVQSHES